MSNQALLQVVYNEPSFCFGAGATRVCVTRLGAMMAPVTFFADSPRPIQPYYIAPWWNEGCGAEVPNLLRTLRGDFFCVPFGGNEAPYQGIQYPPHGQSANEEWTLEGLIRTDAGEALELTQRQSARAGTLRRTLATLHGQSVVYARGEMLGMTGPMCPGYHPNLFVPDEAGQGFLSFAPHAHAHTYLHPTERPEGKGYSFLRPDTAIEDLRRCPTITGETADLTRYPARRGYEDIFMLSAPADLALGWTALAVPSRGYVWFSLKDPRVLASTLVWMSNGGRHFAPWNGRNVNCLGLEEITAFFHEGLAASASENCINSLGIRTFLELTPERATTVNLIQGVARIDPDFTSVARIDALNEGTVRLTSAEKKHVDVSVSLAFLTSGKIKDLLE